MPAPRLGLHARRGARRRKLPTTTLPLAGMVPVLLGLLVYLLPNFRASGECLCANPLSSLDLPRARHGTDLVIAPMLVLTRQALTLDDRLMADGSALERGEPLVQLEQDLETLRRNWRVLHPRDYFHGEVLLAASSDVPFRAIRHVAESARQAGYHRLSFVVTVAEPDPLPDYRSSLRNVENAQRGQPRTVDETACREP